MAHKPFARGVTQLMYVGDVPTVAPPTATDLVPPAALALVAYKTKGATRLASGAAALYLAIRYYAMTHAV